MHTPTTLLVLLLTLSTTTTALSINHPTVKILHIRANSTIDANAVKGTKCGDKTDNIDAHDVNVATLSICSGIKKPIEKCQTNPKKTVGASGTAKFELKVTDAESTIDITKGRWEACVRAARATCPTGGFSSTCVGGATPAGDVEFKLSAEK